MLGLLCKVTFLRVICWVVYASPFIDNNIFVNNCCIVYSIILFDVLEFVYDFEECVWCKIMGKQDTHGSYGSLKVLNFHFSIFKALKVLNLSPRSLKVLNFIFVKSSLNIKVMVVFITCHSLVYTYFYIVFYVFIVKVGCSNYSVYMVKLIISIEV